jgi:hypothetical protein
MAYPAYFTGDRAALPLVSTDSGAVLLRVEFGDYLTDDLIDIFVNAKANACQWVELRDQPVVREEMTWRSISSM